MLKKHQIGSLLLAITLLTSTVFAQSPVAQNRNRQATPFATTTPVTGSGTLGHITKWVGTSIIGDSVISEDKNGNVGISGNVGIGTTAPTSKLTVQGMIQTTLGGYVFPDGTLQTTAGIPSVNHNATLQGDGSGGSPLGIAVPLILNTTLAGSSIIQVANFGKLGTGVTAHGGDSDAADGGTGISGIGGGTAVPHVNTGVNHGGVGVSGTGGVAVGVLNIGGIGVLGTGGDDIISVGGAGLVGIGGLGSGFPGNDGPGIEAMSGLHGLAGNFFGDVVVSGNLAKGGGSFKIDHPLDPENKYLYHSFVESPDMMNIYNGNVTTDANGEAVITLPDWFGALNRDFRYQLTVIGTFAQAIVANEIKDNHFTIKTNAANVKVSWQVTGIRQDAYANQHRIPVEEDKPERERGTYLHPDAFHQPQERNVEWVRQPQLMKQLKQRQQEAEQRSKQ